MKVVIVAIFLSSCSFLEKKAISCLEGCAGALSEKPGLEQLLRECLASAPEAEFCELLWRMENAKKQEVKD